MTIGSRQRIGVTHDNMAIKLDGSEINKVETVKSLGVHIDKHLSWSVHIEKTTKKIASAIGALKRIRPFITTKTAVQVYQFGTTLEKPLVIKCRNYKTEQ